MYNIAIDGPAGAGKSTIAKLLAEKLKFLYIDTGAMFRALAIYVIDNGIDCYDKDALKEKICDVNISIRYIDGEQRVYLENCDVTDRLRSENISNTASIISVYDFVREKLLNIQRNIAANNNVIMDGRDIGSVVLPHADLKIFLTADVDSRAKRRYMQLREQGIEKDIIEIKKDIEKRDDRDRNRDIAPLKVAEDAIILDSSDLSIDDVVCKISNMIK